MHKKQKGNIGIIFLILIIILAGLTGWKYFQPKNTNQEHVLVELSPSLSPPIPVNPLDDWKTLTNMGHTLQYPSDATMEVRADESIVYFMGQKQIDSGRTQTELFDGYSFRIGGISDKTNLSLEQLAKNERDNAQKNCQSENGTISQMLPITIDGQTGYQYDVRGCYMDYTETIISFNNTFYRISQSYVGDTEDYGKYKTITNQVFSSLRFIR